jgi:hypothetical protein
VAAVPEFGSQGEHRVQVTEGAEGIEDDTQVLSISLLAVT